MGRGLVRYVDASAQRCELVEELSAEVSTLQDFDGAGALHAAMPVFRLHCC